MGLCTIWNGPVPDNSEEAQLRKRTEIIHMPSIGSHRQLMYFTPSNDAREGHFRDRHLTSLQFSQQDLEDMQELRETIMELATVAKNRYPPIGYDMEDLITLHAYKPVPPPALSQDRLGDRLVIWGLLEIQRKVKKQEARLSVLEEQLQTLQTLFLIEDWITDKITEMLDERDAVWNEPHEQQEAGTYTNTGTGEQSELLTHTLTQEQNDAAGTENLAQAPEVPNVHMDVDSTGPVHPQGPQPPQEQQLPLQPQDPQQPQQEPTPPPSGSFNPAQNVDSPAAPVLSTLRFMKTVPEFMGNKPKSGDKQRSWEEWKSEFMQNAEACGAHPVHYQVMAQDPVILRTDHQPLTYLPTKGVLGSWQVRWSEYLARFNIGWEYIPGRKNIADALSTMPCLSLYVTTRSQAQQASDAGVKPTDGASEDRLTDLENPETRRSLDEGPGEASLITPLDKGDATGAL